MQPPDQIMENTALSEVHKLVLVMRFVATRIEGNEDDRSRPYEDPIYGALHLAQLLRAGIEKATTEPDLLTALRLTLGDVEDIADDPASYGCDILDKEHPWHETIMRARAAIEKATP